MMKVGLVGNPVSHSLSGVMHNAEFVRQGLDWEYHLWETSGDALAARVSDLRHDVTVRGFNVTVPHKLAVIDSLDAIDEDARLIGAVNTVVRGMDDCFVGRNTDSEGWFADASGSFGTGFLADSAVVLLLGCGGVSRAVAAACVKNGAGKIVIACRRESFGISLAAQIAEMGEICTKRVETAVVGFADISKKMLSRVRLVVNCTPCGMHGVHENETPLADAECLLGANHYVYDTIYTPCETRFMSACRKAGCCVTGGLGMLVGQGALAFEYWTGVTADRSFMQRVLKQHEISSESGKVL